MVLQGVCGGESQPGGLPQMQSQLPGNRSEHCTHNQILTLETIPNKQTDCFFSYLNFDTININILKCIVIKLVTNCGCFLKPNNLNHFGKLP